MADILIPEQRRLRIAYWGIPPQGAGYAHLFAPEFF